MSGSWYDDLSPADVMTHRLLQRYLDGGRSANAEKYEEMCKHCSDMEQIAANAERASIKYKQVEFMSDKLGENFMGTISGVTQWGFYVELNDTKCEGLVSINELEGDYYEFDEENYCIVGRHHRGTVDFSSEPNFFEHRQYGSVNFSIFKRQ